ncbi:hypothetical protein [Palleronia sp.]|uniref:hypothetical protein n=1 Tax=Palleronia sp. TaxID=1940284 RepID=UPI0035C86D86
MRTVTCKTCVNMRSGRIKACPICEDEGRRIGRTATRVTAVVLLCVAAFWSQVATDTPLLRAASANATSSASVWSKGTSGSAAVACEEQLSCWGNLHHDAAVLACRAEMTRQGGEHLQWVPGYASQNFDAYAWHPGAPLAIAYSGDGARVAEPDGGLRLVSYTCGFDPLTRGVIALRID